MSARFWIPILLVLSLCGRGLWALTEQEKRDLFLKAREEMRTVPAATPRPTVRPKPKPATPRATPAPTPKATPKPTPEPEPEPEGERPPVPAPTPAPTPASAPEPAATPTREERRQEEKRLAEEKERMEKERREQEDRRRQGEREERERERAEKTAARPKPSAPITIRKSGLDEDEGFQPPPEREKRGFFGFGRVGPRYRYLTAAVREAIDRAPVKKRRWKFIVVHNSGSRQGNAKIFEYYHRRVRKMPNGMAYHFVIGNGSSSGNGQIEIGGRWTRQINGGHVHSDFLNNIALGICLVGDYNRDTPTPEQLEALSELVRYLHRRCGKVEGRYPEVKPHKAVNPPRWPTDCPGDRFPYKWLGRLN